MRTKHQIQQIVKQVQERLDVKRDKTGMALKVAKDGYMEDEQFLHVIVSPARNGIRAYDYVETLGEIEKDLRESGVDNVVLVPAMAD